MPHSHTPDVFSQAYSRESWLQPQCYVLLCQKCFEFHGEKTFHNINAYLYALLSYSFSFVAIAFQYMYGCHQRSRSSHMVSASAIIAKWHLPVGN